MALFLSENERDVRSSAAAIHGPASLATSCVAFVLLYLNRDRAAEDLAQKFRFRKDFSENLIAADWRSETKRVRETRFAMMELIPGAPNLTD
jgi:hypothetical protein